MTPPFSKHGMHLDLRIQVMPMKALRQFVEEMVGLGMNTLLIEWDASYPFRKHAIISNEFSYTRKEVEDFIEHCTQFGIDVIPLQQCFGHVEYILRHERYGHLREDRENLSQLCPCKSEEALALFEEIFADLASTHPSAYFHIGGDETWLLGHCELCREKAAETGRSELYTSYFKRIADVVIKMSKRPILWADILLKYPEAAGEMPKETVFMDWNYGWPVDHFGDPSQLTNKDFEFWGAPALRSHPDNHSLTCWKKHFKNLEDYIPYARAAGFKGIIQTSWSTSGRYGVQWDDLEELVRMLTTRRVYPLSGFRILMAAFANAVASSDQFIAEEFAVEYAMKRFHLTAEEAQMLWDVLTKGDPTFMAEIAIVPGTGIASALALASEAKQYLDALRPGDHADEFEHLRLMADLREHHLRFKLIQAELQSERFVEESIPIYLRELEKLLDEAVQLHCRFKKANEGFLYPSEFAQEWEYRTGKLQMLRDRLARSGRLAGNGTDPKMDR